MPLHWWTAGGSPPNPLGVNEMLEPTELAVLKAQIAAEKAACTAR